MSVQCFLQNTPYVFPESFSLGTTNLSGCLQVSHNTVLPLKRRLIRFFCSLNDLAVVWFIIEKSILLVSVVMMILD
jgi:hypothetical protein